MLSRFVNLLCWLVWPMDFKILRCTSHMSQKCCPPQKPTENNSFSSWKLVVFQGQLTSRHAKSCTNVAGSSGKGWSRGVTKGSNICTWFPDIFWCDLWCILFYIFEWYCNNEMTFSKKLRDAMRLNQVTTQKNVESNWTVNHLHAEAPKAEAPVVPEAEAPEAPVAVEPSAPPARGHSVFSPSITSVFKNMARCQHVRTMKVERTIFVFASSSHKFYLNQEVS